MPTLNLLMVSNASKAPDAVEPAFTYDVFDPSPTSIGKVLNVEVHKLPTCHDYSQRADGLRSQLCGR